MPPSAGSQYDGLGGSLPSAVLTNACCLAMLPPCKLLVLLPSSSSSCQAGAPLDAATATPAPALSASCSRYCRPGTLRARRSELAPAQG
jgi:hypothetical protein